ncbi:hypothetical protein RND71_023546 [Anisodus tanguticus]|uniref:Uncharacterized protein n=1 Tax=Anisodus tanguticus TaxID=243964 RepID=A0AAE1RVT9_9SOLA|nr:hypothetical protein RND71_023546 [Anisodus tanguticus]
MSVDQSACFTIELPSKEIVLAVARDDANIFYYCLQVIKFQDSTSLRQIEIKQKFDSDDNKGTSEVYSGLRLRGEADGAFLFSS